MKIASFVYQNRSTYGIVKGDHVIDLESLKSHLGADLKEAIARNRLSELGADALKDLPRLALSEITFCRSLPTQAKCSASGSTTLRMCARLVGTCRPTR